MDWSAPIAAGVGAIGSAIGSIGQKRRERLNQKRQHEYNIALADHNFDNNLEMWDLQNQYNTPKAQMQRLQDAGINPHMAYSKGSVSNTSGTAPTYQAEGQNVGLSTALNPMGIISAYQGVRQTNAQVDNLQKQTELTSAKANTENLVQLAKGVGILNDKLKYDVNSKLAPYQVQQAKHNVNKTIAQIALAASQQAKNLSEVSLTGYRKKLMEKQASDVGARGAWNQLRLNTFRKEGRDINRPQYEQVLGELVSMARGIIRSDETKGTIKELGDAIKEKKSNKWQRGLGPKWLQKKPGASGSW